MTAKLALVGAIGLMLIGAALTFIVTSAVLAFTASPFWWIGVIGGIFAEFIGLIMFFIALGSTRK